MKRQHVTAGLALAAALGLATTPANADETIAAGSFKGTNGHVTKGGVSVQKTANGTVVILENNFSFDGAPDPKLGFGKNGYVASTKFSALKKNKGKQVYQLPASIDPGKYDELWVWCEKYAVSLGVAKLK